MKPRAFVNWILFLDEPEGAGERQRITLTKIIEEARIAADEDEKLRNVIVDVLTHDTYSPLTGNAVAARLRWAEAKADAIMKEIGESE